MPRLALRAFVPASLDIQEHDGTAWIGVVPFRMEGVMRRPLPNLPWVSAFPELNVRTYVTSGGKPGVCFFSLDAANPLAVWAARRFFHLPYFHASMHVEPTRYGVSYRSERRSRGTSAAFAARYAPTSDPYEATAGSLEHFLTERYCLYAAAPDGRLWRGEVHHHPWPLQRATAEIEVNTMLRGIVDLPDHPMVSGSLLLCGVTIMLALLLTLYGLARASDNGIQRPTTRAGADTERRRS